MSDTREVALALRAVAARHWRWMEGMLVEWDPPRGAGGAVILPTAARLVQCPDGPLSPAVHGLMDVGRVPVGRRIRPVLSDPATLGCLQALVRDAWGNQTITASRVFGGWRAERWELGRAEWVTPSFRDEIETLVATLEAVP